MGGCNNREPDWQAAGDTLKFTRYFGTYNPQNGWSLTYSVVGTASIAGPITFQSTPTNDQNGFLMDVLPAVTATWLPNDNAVLTGFAERQANWNGGNNPAERHEIYSQIFPIKPNLQNPEQDTPSLTWNQKMLKQLQDLYNQKSMDDLLAAHVGDSAFKFEEKKQLLDQISIFEARCRVDEDKQRAQNGKPSKRRIIPIMSVTPPGPLYGGQWPFGFTGNG